MEEVATEVAGDDEEVNYPADAFGASLSGNFNFKLGILRGRIPVRLWRAIGLEDEIFYAGYFGELSS
ncbi:hypothetical protein F2Q69_00013877 [Brassica cretica]|uniref:Uncharacterized protein n=1 Tax=Brassica cretica TaxID=69181 RepID=A0A8S9QQS9_BRACR|nr:hypothetical protein F2Q69_00013877 [Brassica cretica]